MPFVAVAERKRARSTAWRACCHGAITPRQHDDGLASPQEESTNSPARARRRRAAGRPLDTAREDAQHSWGRGAAAPVWAAAVGVRLSRLLPRVLAGARQRRMGRTLGGDRLPAAAGCLAPQGLVP